MDRFRGPRACTTRASTGRIFETECFYRKRKIRSIKNNALHENSLYSVEFPRYKRSPSCRCPSKGSARRGSSTQELVEYKYKYLILLN